MVNLDDTHCQHGHDLRVGGTYEYRTRTGTVYHQCRECKRGKQRANVQRYRAKVRVGNRSRANEMDEHQRTLRILRLAEEKERAATWWERDEKQRQIDALRDMGRGASR